MSLSQRLRQLAPRTSGIVACVFLAMAPSAVAQTPTVNGWFYGDGDDGLYSQYDTSEYGSVLYSYFDASTATLYVALVVSHSVNDTVCSPQKQYTSSAGWQPPRDCGRLTDSEFAAFSLECAPGSTTRSWSWDQALGCSQTAGPPPSDWISDPTCGPSSPAADWPPSIVATTSWVQNVNNYQAADPSTRAWDLYANGTVIDDWKSPFLSSAPNDVTQVPGYNTFSDTDTSGTLFYEWEWSMVYEWSLKLGPDGVDCGNEPIFFITGNSHHSPSKNGDENDEFFPDGDEVLADWGDLPDSYGTTDAAGGAQHYLTVSGPYLGQGVQAELDGQPTNDATGDGSEEDGVTANVTSNWTPGSTQTVDVEVGNAASGALLGGWFDWNGDGDVADAGEFFSWNVSEGTNQLQLTVGQGFDWQNDQLYARFRLFSSAAAAPGGSLDATDYAGLNTVDEADADSSLAVTDGEVEDYSYSPGTLPVTLNAFASEGTAGGELTLRWQTASETDNVAFEVLGLVDGEWLPLGELIPSRSMNSALPEGYEVRVTAPAGLTALRLVDYDSRGRGESFGPFAVGAGYGEVQPVRTVDWSGPRAWRAERLRAQGFQDTAWGSSGLARKEGGLLSAGAAPAGGAERWKKVRRGEPVGGATAEHHAGSVLAVRAGRGGGPGRSGSSDGEVRVQTGPLTHVAVREAGVQRVTYEALRDGGLDLAGVPAGKIAVTWRGEPVARWIDGQGLFGPGSAIEFVGRPPEGDDALYVDANLYQVSVDPVRAREAGKLGRGHARNLSASYLEDSWVDEPRRYNQQSPTGDPWVDRTVLVRRGRAATVTLDLPVEGPVADGPAHLTVGLGTITDLPDRFGPDGAPIPEHNVEVRFRGPSGSFEPVATASASGHRAWTLEAELPAGLVEAGVNQVELQFTTEYFFSLVVVDRYGVGYPRPYRGTSLDFPPDPWADGYRVEGFATPEVSVYAQGADGSLTRVVPDVAPSAGGGYAAEIRQVETPVEADRLWVTESPHRPEVFTTEAPPDLLSEPGALVILAGSSFVDTRALEDYVSARSAFDPVVVDVEDVYNAVGYGMALPSALTDYLAAREAVQPFTHVQLVGTDCYDRRNYISSCISHVPLPTAPVGVNVYSPSQNRLVDLDGDGVGDKAVGQFSVRDAAELSTIVDKAAAWDASELPAGSSALLIADGSDGHHDFAAQIERLRRVLGWQETDVLRLADHPSIGTAREAMRSSLEEGRTVTVFSGHSSPTIWSFRSFLTPRTAAALTNEGRPTIMVPLACETTYDISPNANVLGHQLLYAGGQGALAISGAVALSSLSDNERMANHVLDGLKAGLTLGQAVQAGREALGTGFQTLLDNWLTQGDATVRLER